MIRSVAIFARANFFLFPELRQRAVRPAAGEARGAFLAAPLIQAGRIHWWRLRRLGVSLGFLVGHWSGLAHHCRAALVATHIKCEWPSEL